MKTANDYNLDAMVADWSIEIFESTSDRYDAIDRAWEYADGSRWVIYHYKAHQICANCNTDNGEDFIAEIGQPKDGWTYDTLASAIAFGEIVTRLQIAVSSLYDIAEESI